MKRQQLKLVFRSNENFLTTEEIPHSGLPWSFDFVVPHCVQLPKEVEVFKKFFLLLSHHIEAEMHM